MFDLHSTERLAAWKQFRDSLETSDTALLDVAEFWSRAPFVSAYLDPNDPSEWPDPWHLVIDCHLDDLAIALGMLYTIKLTQRFSESECEIHMSMYPDRKEPSYLLIVDKKYVLNFEYRAVVQIDRIKSLNTKIIYTKTKI